MGHYEAFVESFYKMIKNTLDFKDGANLILNNHIETALIPGNMYCYGAEFSIRKIKGRLEGSINYTLSRSFRRSINQETGESINDGGLYPSNFDQPHIVNFDFRYGISRRIFFSGNFSYRTGRPTSLPEAAYSVDGIPIQSFKERNSYRIRDYHRLDIAFVIEGNHKRKKLWDGKWVFSFYNTYARKNPYALFFNPDTDGKFIPYELSIVGTIIPSITYSFQF